MLRSTLRRSVIASAGQGQFCQHAWPGLAGTNLNDSSAIPDAETGAELHDGQAFPSDT
jgi:hypothetical protein